MILHNKYFEILKQFSDGYTIELHGRGIIDQVSLSQKGIALALEELENIGVLSSKKLGNMKAYSLDFRKSQTKKIMQIIELQKAINFLNKNPSIKYAVKDSKGMIVVFGSYTKETQGKRSDIDILIVGDKDKYIEKNAKTVNLPISTKYFTKKQWQDILRQKNSLSEEIVRGHIILNNTEGFIDMLWDAYGFDKMVLE
jgi:predicted nucleotidyltransferase